MAMQLQCVCHDTLPWLISFSLDDSHTLLFMALTTCPDCGTDVSTKASACPKCGAPVFERSARGTVTTQRTGKSIKAQKLLFQLLLVIAVIWFFIAKAAESPVGWPVALFFVAVFMLYVTRFRRWWHHD